MTTEQFLAEVMQKAPDDFPVGILRRAMKETVGDSAPSGSAVADCITRAGQLVDQTGRPGRRQSQDVPLLHHALPQTPGSRITSTVRAQALEPWVRELRRDLFGKERPPFRSVKTMERWLTDGGAQAPASGPTTPGPPSGFRTLRYRDIVEPGKRTALKGPGGARMWTHSRTRPRQRSGWNAAVLVTPGTKLAQLADAVAGLDDATGFDEAALVRFVLVGTPPALAPSHWIAHARPTDRRLRPRVGRKDIPLYLRYVVLTIEACDLSQQAMVTLYHDLATQLGIAKRKVLTDEDELLVQIAANREIHVWADPIPSRRGVWESIARDWTREQRERVPWRTLLQRFRRVAKLYR